MAVHSEQLVTTQFRLWELKRTLEKNGERRAPTRFHGVPCGPCLLISREYGSEGDAIARKAGERLGWHVYDREIVEQIAEHAHLRQRLIESVDERARSFWEALRMTLSPDNVDPDRYHVHLAAVIRALGHHGDVVLVGRGAQYLLPAGAGLRVRVVAPRGARIDRVAATEGLSSDEARAKVDRIDAERAAFYRRTFDRDASHALDYDLVLNSEDLGVDAAVEVILAGMHAKLGIRAG